MTNPTNRGRKIRRTAAVFGIALAALTLSNTAQADRGDRGLRSRDGTVHTTRDTNAHRNRGDRSTRRDVRRDRDNHAGYRGHNRWRHGHWYGHGHRPRVRAGLFPGRYYGPHRHGRPVVLRPHRHAAGRGCRIVRHVRFDHYGRKIISKRRVCYGRHGR